MPWNRADYPVNWEELRLAVMERAGWRCEGSPAFPDCRAENGKPHPETGSIVVLTTAHLFDDDHQTQDITRMRAWCKICNLIFDHPMHVRRAMEPRRRRRALADLPGLET
jgi:hypothetical protein